MREPEQGILIYDSMTDRLDIRFSLEEYYGGLHCGQVLEVEIDGVWKPVRVEKSDEWYLVGLKNTTPILGLNARI